jgi:hypothetical protein
MIWRGQRLYFGLKEFDERAREPFGHGIVTTGLQVRADDVARRDFIMRGELWVVRVRSHR